jgi:hypothetical protein
MSRMLVGCAASGPKLAARAGCEKVLYVRNLATFMRYTQSKVCESFRILPALVRESEASGLIMLLDRQPGNLSCRKAGRLVYKCAQCRLIDLPIRTTDLCIPVGEPSISGGG